MTSNSLEKCNLAMSIATAVNAMQCNAMDARLLPRGAMGYSEVGFAPPVFSHQPSGGTATVREMYGTLA
ncbi:hypothetical protein HJFPF1_05114 [Paramyrothecium foliicola]|nr:hypothetical protein HJFPF1_05114 [Paramyrothecium foliicola]